MHEHLAQRVEGIARVVEHRDVEQLTAVAAHHPVVKKFGRRAAHARGDATEARVDRRLVVDPLVETPDAVGKAHQHRRHRGVVRLGQDRGPDERIAQSCQLVRARQRREGGVARSTGKWVIGRLEAEQQPGRASCDLRGQTDALARSLGGSFEKIAIQLGRGVALCEVEGNWSADSRRDVAQEGELVVETTIAAVGQRIVQCPIAVDEAEVRAVAVGVQQVSGRVAVEQDRPTLERCR